MKLKAHFWLLSFALVGTLLLSACGGGGGTSGGGTANLNLASDGESLAFAPATLSAAAGSQVSVTFKDASASQQHNWVLVKGGDEVAAKVDEAGATAGADKGYIPDDPNIITNIKLLNGGESGTTSFAAPPPGTYTYLCTFPGHYAAGMKGTLTIK
jgi:plastocyanin